MADLFFLAISFAVIVAVCCMGVSIGRGRDDRNAPPNFKPGAVDPHSTPRGER